MNLGSCARCWEKYSQCTCSEEEIEAHKQKRNVPKETPITRETIAPIQTMESLTKRYGVPGFSIQDQMHIHANMYHDLTINTFPTIIPTSKHQEEQEMSTAIKAVPLHVKRNTNQPFVAHINGKNRHVFVEGSEFITSAYLTPSTVGDTAPLRFDTEINLFAISNLTDLIGEDWVEQTTLFTRDIKVGAVYVSVGGSVMKFDISGVDNNGPMYNDESPTVNFDIVTSEIVIDKDTVDINNEAFNYAHLLAVHDTSIRLKVAVHGKINLETGLSKFIGGIAVDGVTSPQVIGVDGYNVLSKLIVAALGEVKMIGYDINAYFVGK